MGKKSLLDSKKRFIAPRNNGAWVEKMKYEY